MEHPFWRSALTRKIPAGRDSPLAGGPCEEPRPAEIPLGALLEDLQEAERPGRGHDQAARAMEQAHPG